MGNAIHILDVAAKLDQTADFICKPKWEEMPFPPPFGREAYPEVKICRLSLFSGEFVRTNRERSNLIGWHIHFLLVRAKKKTPSERQARM